MTRQRFILAVFCSALFGMLLAVLTNQGQFTPTAAKPRPPRTEVRWIRPPQIPPSSTPTFWNSIPTFTTPPKSAAASGNTVTPTPTTPHPKDPTTTAPSTSANQTATTGTSTPDPTTTTSTADTTTTEGGLMPSTTTTDATANIETPPGSDEKAPRSVAGVTGRVPGSSPGLDEGLSPLQLATGLFGPEPDKLPGYWAGQRHFYPWPGA